MNARLGWAGVKPRARPPRWNDLLDALERSARDGGIVLQGESGFLAGGKANPVAIEFDAWFHGGTHVKRYEDGESFTSVALASLGSEG